MKGCGRLVLTSRVGKDDGVNCGGYIKNVYDGKRTLFLCDDCKRGKDKCEI